MGIRSKIFNLANWAYLAHGALGRTNQSKRCPCCGELASTTVDRKFFHTLEACAGCRILYRYPGDPAAQSVQFYQEDYAEPGLITELPSPEELRLLLASGFKGSPKDFSKVISIFEALGIKPGSRVLDYGASWGYASWQFIQAGFPTVGFEISKPRAAYGSRLGLTIETDAARLAGPFDVVYSNQVLEHVPDPVATLRQHLEWTRPGGYVIAHTPNGSGALRAAHPKGFRGVWGKVHPFLLTDEFVIKFAENRPLFMASRDEEDELSRWNQASLHRGAVDGFGLFFVLRNQGY